MLLASTADAVGVADAIDAGLAEWQNPNLLHTTGNTMTSLALALALGGDDANDVDLLGPLVATGLVDQVPSDSTVHRRHKELSGRVAARQRPVLTERKRVTPQRLAVRQQGQGRGCGGRTVMSP